MAIETGDYVVWTEGVRETWDWGLADVDGDEITVQWRSSGQTTTQPASSLRQADVYTTFAAAEVAWGQALAAFAGGFAGHE